MLAPTRLVKVRGQSRWVSVPAYVQRPCTSDEVAELFHQAEHELARSGDPATDLATRYRASVEAALRLATLVIRASGYETCPRLEPTMTFDALPTLFGPEGRELAKSFLDHQRRSQRKGGSPRSSLERKLDELRQQADRFRESIREWLVTTRRSLVPAKRSGSDAVGGHQKTLF